MKHFDPSSHCVHRPENRIARTGLVLLLLVGLASCTSVVSGQSLSYNVVYQGQLLKNGEPVSGDYSVRVSLWDALQDGNQVGSSHTFPSVLVQTGIFQLDLDPQYFGTDVFNGDQRYLALEVAPQGGSFELLEPRQRLSATPYAWRALTSVEAEGLSATVATTDKVTNLNADLLDGFDASSFWSLTGNAGTVAGANYVGTSDDQPLEFRANDQRVLRLEAANTSAPYTPSYSANVLAGSPYNRIASGTQGATISGGGLGIDTPVGFMDFGNVVNAGMGTVAGGWANVIQSGANSSTIGGGEDNEISTNAYHSVISGGYLNFVGSGAAYAAIPGGQYNHVEADYSLAAGYRAKALHNGTFVWADNQSADFASTDDKQFLVRASGGVAINTNAPAGAALNVNGTVRATQFEGDGSGLTNLPSPALGNDSVTAVNIAPSQVVKSLNGLRDDVTLQSGSNISISQNANQITISASGGVGVEGWNLGGNSGTTPGLDFVGTTDNQALQLKVNNSRALLLSPHATSPNLVGGYSGNTVDNGAYGVTIGGGGELGGHHRASAKFTTLSGGRNHSIESAADYATISGGADNRIKTFSDFASVGGGLANDIRDNSESARIGGGWQNTIETQGSYAFVGGGRQNQINTNGYASVISGGQSNRVNLDAKYSAIGGGFNNVVGEDYATVPGGAENKASGYNSFAAGYRAKAIHNGSFVWSDYQTSDFVSAADNEFAVRATGGVRFNTFGHGLEIDGPVHQAGANNSLTGNFATIAGGRLNTNAAVTATIGGGDANRIDIGANDAVIAGGDHNVVNANSFGAAIGGGAGNKIDASTAYGTIGGGFVNWIAAGGAGSTIGGGQWNNSAALFSTIGGGSTNTVFATATNATIAGGDRNRVYPGAWAGTVGGGIFNSVAEDAFAGTVGGGQQNVAGGNYATVPGGLGNQALGDYSFAAGRNAVAGHDGSFVWRDTVSGKFSSSSSNQFLIFASGGVGIGTDAPEKSLHVLGNNAPEVRVQHTGSGSAALGLKNNDREYSVRMAANEKFVVRDVTAGDVDRLTIATDGKVGIGTASPKQALHVNGDYYGKGHFYLHAYEGDGNDGSAYVQARDDSGTSSIGLKFRTQLNGDIVEAMQIGTDGVTTVKVITITGGSDIAEPFNVHGSDDIVPGMVVSIDPNRVGELCLTTQAYDSTVAGIISGANGIKPGLTLSQENTVADGKHPVALTGRVWCYADADASGPIKPGDTLTSSNTPGHAMKAGDKASAVGAILGKAMSPLESGKGMVLVLVNLH